MQKQRLFQLLYTEIIQGDLFLKYKMMVEAWILNTIHRFFNLGDSNKSKPGIGEKGLGTKTYFKSDRITLYTQTRDNRSYKVIMDNPWECLCNDKIPEYTVEKF